MLRLFLNQKMLVILLCGFSSGLPLALVGSTLQAWMSSRHIDITVIGLFSLVGLPYTLKFLWSPLMDRFVPPFLGRRRGWILITQFALFLCLTGMAFCDPEHSLQAFAIFAFLTAFASASQDIVMDAYKTELLDPNEFGAGAAVANMGYRVAMLTSGACALILSDHLSWQSVYISMASVFIISMGVTWCAPEPIHQGKPPCSLQEAVIAPLLEFFKRKRVAEILSFIIMYKLDVVVAMALMTPFMMELGFTRTEIGAVTKGFGLLATLLGTFVGGAWMLHLGLYRSLWVFGLLQGISGFCFYLLARLGHHYPMMVVTIAAENFCSGMGNAAYAALVMSLCNPRFTATQFALLTSLMALTRTVAGAPTGWLVKTVGWEFYFLISIFLAIPALLLLPRFKEGMKEGMNEA